MPRQIPQTPNKDKDGLKNEKAYANFSLVGCTKEKTLLKGL